MSSGQRESVFNALAQPILVDHIRSATVDLHRTQSSSCSYDSESKVSPRLSPRLLEQSITCALAVADTTVMSVEKSCVHDLFCQARALRVQKQKDTVLTYRPLPARKSRLLSPPACVVSPGGCLYCRLRSGNMSALFCKLRRNSGWQITQKGSHSLHCHQRSWLSCVNGTTLWTQMAPES